MLPPALQQGFKETLVHRGWGQIQTLEVNQHPLPPPSVFLLCVYLSSSQSRFLMYKIHDFHQSQLSCRSDEEERVGKDQKAERRSPDSDRLSEQYADSSAAVKRLIN
ncbi:hypothetical protein Baya_15292 [Bagarius yarrelli]|uniref:Uncharacterized protein n=1 Tax=Bagarius yarrelli TaxID=175774 RepID=A0A556VBF4_BAGYA|nr:hypothetical protein Baya_15292 [Bagarius yarrelli]